MFSFTLLGEMPSKKNNYRHSVTTRRVYIDKAIQIGIDSFLYQLPKIRNKLGIKQPIDAPIVVQIEFYGDLKRDLDNVVTTLLDILQKGQIIKNDKQVFKLVATKCYNDKPYVVVHIEPLTIPYASQEDKNTTKESKRTKAPPTPLKKRSIKTFQPMAP